MFYDTIHLEKFIKEAERQIMESKFAARVREEIDLRKLLGIRPLQFDKHGELVEHEIFITSRLTPHWYRGVTKPRWWWRLTRHGRMRHTHRRNRINQLKRIAERQLENEAVSA